MSQRLTMLLTVLFCLGVSTMRCGRDGRPGETSNGVKTPAPPERKVEPAKPKRDIAKASAKSTETLDPEEFRKQLTRIKIAGADNALLLYSIDKDGDLPKGKGPGILEALTRKNDLNGDRIFDDPWLADHKDAWGRPLLYEWPTTKWPDAKKPAVWSRGPNGNDEGGYGDDVRNWK